MSGTFGSTHTRGDHSDCPEDTEPCYCDKSKPTEMTSLTQIKDKLDAIKEQLRTMDAGLHETAMRNHQQVLAQFRPPRKARKKARSAVGKAR